MHVFTPVTTRVGIAVVFQFTEGITQHDHTGWISPISQDY